MSTDIRIAEIETLLRDDDKLSDPYTSYLQTKRCLLNSIRRNETRITVLQTTLRDAQNAANLTFNRPENEQKRMTPFLLRTQQARVLKIEAELRFIEAHNDFTESEVEFLDAIQESD